MRYPTPLIGGRLQKRYKRFLADVILDDGREVTVHSPNTGAMLGCAEPGQRVWVRDTGNDTRKYPFAWELSETDTGVLIGINTILSNHLVREAIEVGRVAELSGYEAIKSEVKVGDSRLDLRLSAVGLPDCFVEVKNVTARAADAAIFPDAVSARGLKHLQTLMRLKADGHRAVMFYVVQRNDVTSMRTAVEIDLDYARAFEEARAVGVEMLAYATEISQQDIAVKRSLPLSTPEPNNYKRSYD